MKQQMKTGTLRVPASQSHTAICDLSNLAFPLSGAKWYRMLLSLCVISLLTAKKVLHIEQADDLSPDDLFHFNRRNSIPCAIGWTDVPCIPTRSLPLYPADRILLYIDGILFTLKHYFLESPEKHARPPSQEN